MRESFGLVADLDDVSMSPAALVSEFEITVVRVTPIKVMTVRTAKNALPKRGNGICDSILAVARMIQLIHAENPIAKEYAHSRHSFLTARTLAPMKKMSHEIKRVGPIHD
ncbi:MAG: hypothetical protein ACXADD_20170 [Candidatus Thorarchaeota archaeon]